MKATGIVRRIDDLGRIMIPREIRRTMQINEGDPLEIGILNDEIILTKYEPVFNLIETVDKLKSKIAFDVDLKNRNELLQKIRELETLLKEEKQWKQKNI